MNGLINFLKPPFMSSSDAVGMVKRIYRQTSGMKIKAGHMGTLDPLASGVLLIGLGNTVRLFDRMQLKTKRYLAFITFGVETDTIDSEGKVLRKSSFIPNYNDFCNTLPFFQGEIMQIPPQYSAIHIDGIKAYDKARKGIVVEIPARKINISAIKAVRKVCENTYSFEVECQSGTYIRSLVRDIAEKLGAIAYMSALIRLASGRFEIGQATSREELEKNFFAHVIDTERVLQELRTLQLSESDFFKVKNGVKLAIENLSDGEYAVKSENVFLGIGEVCEGELRIKTRLDG